SGAGASTGRHGVRRRFGDTEPRAGPHRVQRRRLAVRSPADPGRHGGQPARRRTRRVQGSALDVAGADGARTRRAVLLQGHVALAGLLSTGLVLVLQLVELAVVTVVLEQLEVVALFDQLAFAHHHDLVDVLDG